MKISIRNPAPLGRNLMKWGDYHFGQSLQAALERKGVEVVQRYWPEWGEEDGDADAVLVLRGKRVFVPRPGQVALMWVLSHPAAVTLAEIQSYSLVFLASETHRKLLGAARVQTEVMRQCTDVDRFGVFNGVGQDADHRRGIVFVANSRGMRRPMVRWALESGTPLDVYGRHWKEVEPQLRVKQEYVENEALPALYARSRLSLNDHWGDMAHYGVINNRIFDCLACGTPVLSDDFPELREVCGSALLYAGDPTAFSSAIQRYTLRYPELIDATRELWSRIGRQYTFDARADQIIAAVDSSLEPVRGGAPARVDPATSAGPLFDVVRNLRDRGTEGEIKAVHVNPTEPLMHEFQRIDEISYLSAGAGAGGWHLRLDRDMDLLPARSLDLLVIDPAGRASEQDIAEWLPGAVRKVKVNGLIFVAGKLAEIEAMLVGQCGCIALEGNGKGLYQPPAHSDPQLEGT